MNNVFQEFISCLNSEYGLSVKVEQSNSNIPLPEALKCFYSYSNGIELPFVEIYPCENIDIESIPGWSIIGFDGYFSYVIFNNNQSEYPFDLWDHESGNPPEGAYKTLIELLQDMYKEYLNKEQQVHLRINAISENITPTKVVLCLKGYSSLSNQELLSLVKQGSFSLELNSLSLAQEAKVKLNSLGIHGDINHGI
mgnify:CR=1 FL=1